MPSGHSVSFFQMSFLQIIARLYNKIPNELKSNSLLNFKIQRKKYFLPANVVLIFQEEDMTHDKKLFNLILSYSNYNKKNYSATNRINDVKIFSFKIADRFFIQ